ncbi:hypothetical protein L479_01008 [Exiguobacterium sp. S17]|nr:hypothetical protein L479_01008 [Exiguobacterium sp. S17]
MEDFRLQRYLINYRKTSFIPSGTCQILRTPRHRLLIEEVVDFPWFN